MKKIYLIAALIMAVLSLGVGAFAQIPAPYAEFAPHPPPAGEPIEVLPGSLLEFWFHVGWDGHTGEEYILEEVTYRPGEAWRTDGQPPSITVGWTPMMQPGTPLIYSQWYPHSGMIVDGRPSDHFEFWLDLHIRDAQGQTYDYLSEKYHIHISPEPSSLLALGSGLVGAGGLLLRRRRII